MLHAIIGIYIYIKMNSSSHYASWLLLAWSAYYTTAQVGMRNGPRRTRHAAAAICSSHHAMLAAVTLLSATPETFFEGLDCFSVLLIKESGVSSSPFHCAVLIAKALLDAAWLTRDTRLPDDVFFRRMPHLGRTRRSREVAPKLTTSWSSKHVV